MSLDRFVRPKTGPTTPTASTSLVRTARVFPNELLVLIARAANKTTLARACKDLKAIIEDLKLETLTFRTLVSLQTGPVSEGSARSGWELVEWDRADVDRLLLVACLTCSPTTRACLLAT